MPGYPTPSQPTEFFTTRDGHGAKAVACSTAAGLPLPILQARANDPDSRVPHVGWAKRSVPIVARLPHTFPTNRPFHHTRWARRQGRRQANGCGFAFAHPTELGLTTLVAVCHTWDGQSGACPSLPGYPTPSQATESFAIRDGHGAKAVARPTVAGLPLPILQGSG